MNKVQNVEYFSVQYSELIYKKTGRIYINFIEHVEYDYYGFLNAGFKQYGKHGKHYLYDINKNVEIETLQILSPVFFEGNEGIYFDNYGYDPEARTSTFDVIKYNIHTKQTSTLLKGTIAILSKQLDKSSLLFYNPRIILKSFSLLTGAYNWEVDLNGYTYEQWGETKQATIQQLVGVWQNRLIASLTSGDIVCLDVHNGHTLWQIQGLIQQHLSIHPIQKQRYFVWNLHLQEGKLYELASSLYYSIDLTTQEVTILWQDEREEDYVTVVHPTYTSEYVYFTGSLNNAFQPHLLGVFNRQTLQLDWVHNVALEVDPALGYVASLNQSPQVSDTKLYVLDSGGTLHIFEQE